MDDARSLGHHRRKASPSSPLSTRVQGGTHHADDGGRAHLTVEVMPGGQRWEWLAWLARDPSRYRDGLAASAAFARRLAEDAAAALDRRRTPARASLALAPDAAQAAAPPADRRRVVRRVRPAPLPGHAAARSASRRGRLP